MICMLDHDMQCKTRSFAGVQLSPGVDELQARVYCSNCLVGPHLHQTALVLTLECFELL